MIKFHEFKNKFLALLFFLLIFKLNIYPLTVYTYADNIKQLGLGNCDMKTNGEKLIIKNCLFSKDSVIFDAGANVGDWSKQILKFFPEATIYLFEPLPTSYQKIKIDLSMGNVFSYNLALSDHIGERTFFFYQQHPRWSSFYYRPSIHEKPVEIKVVVETIDNFCLKNNINMIDFLKIDTEGSELDILKGASGLLKNGLINMIQFEYGGTYKDTGITLQEVYNLLKGYDYSIFRIFEEGLIDIKRWQPGLENYIYSNYLAIRASEKVIFK